MCKGLERTTRSRFEENGKSNGEESRILDAVFLIIDLQRLIVLKDLDPQANVSKFSYLICKIADITFFPASISVFANSKQWDIVNQRGGEYTNLFPKSYPTCWRGAKVCIIAGQRLAVGAGLQSCERGVNLCMISWKDIFH